MAEIRMSSDEARSKWREVLDTAVAGNQIIIERYGKPVAVLVPHADYASPVAEAKAVREATAVYQTRDWETVKAELLAELRQELFASPTPAESPQVANVYSPRLMHPEQVADFQKEIVAELPNADV